MKNRYSIKMCLGLLVALFICVFFPVEIFGGDVDFIVPGVSLRSVSFDVGARVTYLIVSQTHGTSDSSVVELAVLDSTSGGISLEVTSSPFPALDEETVTVRLLLGANVKEISSPGEIRPCIKEVLVKDGGEPFREPTEDEIEDFDFENIFLSSSEGMKRNRLPDECVETPAGNFLCEVDELSRKTVRPVKLGGIDAERSTEERSVLWFSDEVPFWGLVRSRVEVTNSTKVLGEFPFRDWKPRTTVTESVLMSYKHPGE